MIVCPVVIGRLTAIAHRQIFSRRLRELRLSQKISQQSLAKRINSSQSRVAKMEAGDPSVSLDLIVRTLLAMGATREDVAIALVQRNEVIASSQS